jgi:hypothetical protein
MVTHLNMRKIVVPIYMSNTFYGYAPIVNGLFLLNLESMNTHIHNIDAKICKVDSDNSTYLWHYCLGHIGVNHMKKLHSDGLLRFLNHLTHVNHAVWER